MSLRFQSALNIENLPDEQIDNQFEVIMPTLNLEHRHEGSGWFTKLTSAVINSINEYTPIVEEIVFGVKNFKTNTRRVRTGWCNVPEDIQNYQDVSITMFCSAGMLTQYYLAAWKALIFNEEGEYYNPMQDYKKNIEVYFFGPGNIGTVVPPIAHFTLKGCFPYTQDPFKLSYKDNPQRLRITANFKVDKIVVDNSLKSSSIKQELLTSPTQLLNTAFTKATSLVTKTIGLTDYSGVRDYSVKDVYGIPDENDGA